MNSRHQRSEMSDLKRFQPARISVAAATRSLGDRRDAVKGLLFIAAIALVGFTGREPLFAWQRLAFMVPTASVAALGPDQQGLRDSDDRNQDASVENLIDQLDSRDFATRELATEKIIDHGDFALPLLAERFFDRSPETNYRIRKALEGIASAGDEETFLRSAAILLTLYSNGNNKIFQQIAELKIKWQAIRTQKVIQSLRRTGVEITERNGVRPVIIRDLQANPIRQPTPLVSDKRSPAQQRQQIETILKASPASNREFVFQSTTDQPTGELALAIGMANLNSSQHLVGTTISFPAGWSDRHQQAELLGSLRQIDGRLFVDVADANFSASQWDAFSNADNIAALTLSLSDSSVAVPDRLPSSLQALTLQDVEFNNDLADALQNCPKLQQLILKNCRFTSDLAEQINDCQSLKNIVVYFENMELMPEQALAMAPLENLKTLHLENTKLAPATLRNLRRLSNLNVLYVSNIPATADFFDSVSAMKQLRNIQFKGCKLDIPAYKKLDQGQRVRMNFEAQAFLGIQGSGLAEAGRPNSGDTMVSMVIPESAAELGGIVAGDFINRIEGEKVESFNDVRLHITQFAAGDEVEIEVLRNGQPKTLTVTLRDFKTARKF